MSELPSAGIRVGVVTSTFPFSHTEAFLHAELEALKRQGCQLTIFPAIPKGNENTRRDLQVDVVRFPVLSPNTLYRAARGLRHNARAAAQTLRTIMSARNGFVTKLKNLALFPTGLAVADEVRARRLDHIHAHWLSGPSSVAFIASQIAGVSWSYSAHSWDIFLEDNLIAAKTGSAKFGRVISEFGRRGLLSKSREAGTKPLEVIHLGVAVPDRISVPQTPRPRRLRLVCPANFYYFKDHITLLRALREAVDAGIDCECIFAGEGPLRASVSRAVKELRLESVVSMPGVIPHEQLLQQLRTGEYDAVALASIDLEGIPVSLIEAMAAGVPCIATRLGAIGELIDAQCGILVDQKDAHGFAQAIIAFASDPERRADLGRRAREKVTTAFDTTSSARSLLRLMTQRP